MKRYIKIVLLILISCCYVNTVFEFSDIEEKQNFDKESHCYISQNTLKLNIPETTTQSKVTVFKSDDQPRIVLFPVIISKITTNNYLNEFFLPPQKRYIIHASLLI